MNYKITYGGKNKVLKIQEILNYAALRAKIIQIMPAIPEDCELKYTTTQAETESLNNDQDFHQMKNNHKKVKIFVVGDLNISSNSFKSKTSEQKKEEKPQMFAQQFIAMTKGSKKIEQVIIDEPKKQDMDPNAYYICNQCQKCIYSGQRYRCLGCKDWNMCQECIKIKKKDLKKHPKAGFAHEFVLIKDQKEWNNLDFRPLIRAYLDPNFGTEVSDSKGKKEAIHYDDIITESGEYKMEMSQWIKYYSKIFEDNVQNWINNFKDQAKKRRFR